MRLGQSIATPVVTRLIFLRLSTLPYMPNSRPDVIVCDELLTDRKNGDFDTIAILYIKKSDGERVEVNRYFKENDASFTEISPEEYKERQRLQEERIKSEAEK